MRRDSAVGLLAAAGSVALITVLIAVIRAYARIDNVSMLYLLAVLAVATRYGSTAAVLASLLAFLAYNFFFIEPVHNLTVTHPEEWLSLVLLLAASAVTGQLAARQRQQAAAARRREAEALQLYAIGRRLAGAATLDAALQQVVEYLQAELGLAGCAILLADERGATRVVASAGEAGAALEREQPRWVLAADAPREKRRPRRWVRVRQPAPAGERGDAATAHALDLPLQVSGRTYGTLRAKVAAVAPRLSATQERLLEVAADQIASAAERAALQEEVNAAEVLRRTDELRAALLSSISHDLRTPLASIKAAAGSLRQHDVRWSEAERDGFAATIESEADRLNRLVGNLLDLSRIEAGALRPDKDWYSLSALADDVVGRLRPAATVHVLTCDVPDELPPLPFDYVQIDAVLTNLVENALKHTPPGTRVTLSARLLGDAVQVTVADNGPGIPDQALPHLFEKFYRVRGEPGGPRGTGLGLAVAKGLVEAHGGAIWVDSTPGRGSAFRFTLPLGTPPQAAALAAPAEAAR